MFKNLTLISKFLHFYYFFGEDTGKVEKAEWLTQPLWKLEGRLESGG